MPKRLNPMKERKKKKDKKIIAQTIKVYMSIVTMLFFCDKYITQISLSELN